MSKISKRSTPLIIIVFVCAILSPRQTHADFSVEADHFIDLLLGVVVDDPIDPPTARIESIFNLRTKSSIPDAGHNEASLVQAKPAISLSKWDGESMITVKYDNVRSGGALIPGTDKVEWQGNLEKVQAYPLRAHAGLTDGGFEIEVVLEEKPDTNVFDFAIEGAEDLDFFYQPELTAEEIAGGAYRPENVIGSYAVYHKTKINHRVGDTNYANGKAYHIFRPMAVDAIGREAWSVLSYHDGMLTVTVPQYFLDRAVYPVRVDPTFGYATVGGSYFCIGAGFDLTALVSLAGQYTASSGDTLNTFSIYAMSTSSQNFDFAAYTLSAGSPTVRLGAVTTMTVPGSSGGWHTSSDIARAMAAGTTYGIGFVENSPVSNPWCVAYDGGTAPGRVNSSSNATTLNDPFGGVTSDSGRHYSIYATYTSAPPASTAKPRVIIRSGFIKIINSFLFIK